MRNARRFLTVLVFLVGLPAFAQNSRSAVSISGNDANPCTVASPCRSFAAAVAQTAIDGEVVAVDSGGYGPFAITQRLTVSGAPGVHAAITTSSTSPYAITITVPQNNSATVRNLVILPGASALRGVDAGSTGTVYISNCFVRGFSNGVAIESEGADTLVDNTVVENNYEGVDLTGFGRITDSRIDGNFIVGVRVTAPAQVLIAGSSLSENGSGIIDISETARVAADVTIDHDKIAKNDVGAEASSIDAASDATIRLFASTISYNNLGVACNFPQPCLVYTYGNNAVSANTLDFQSVIPTSLAMR